jgi:hypothetical protein
MRLSPFAAPLQFLAPVIADGKIKLEWSGQGVLQRAPTINGPWTPMLDPMATSPYEETVLPGQNRFFRLQEIAEP